MTDSKTAPARKPSRQFVVITGLSGSGKGSVLKAFEDLGFYCVDNLPIDLIPKFADLWAAPRSQIERAAVVVDIREGKAISQLPAMYRSLSRNTLRPSLVFLEASDRAVIRRFEDARRPRSALYGFLSADKRVHRSCHGLVALPPAAIYPRGEKLFDYCVRMYRRTPSLGCAGGTDRARLGP